MVLLVELLLAAGVLYGVYRLALSPDAGMAAVEPDRSPSERQDGPLTADELVAMHLPAGFGYRKVDVDLLLDRLARQLPRAPHAPADAVPVAAGEAAPAERAPDASERISLLKEEDDRG